MRFLQPLRFHLWRLRDAANNLVFGTRYRRRIFQSIYEANAWADAASVSGTGSSLDATGRIREALPALWAARNVTSLLDAPCGDFGWMRLIVAHLDRYVGVDIVPALIERNQREFGSDRVRFEVADMTTDPLPRCDMILCRDAMIHLPTSLIVSTLRGFRASG